VRQKPKQPLIQERRSKMKKIILITIVCLLVPCFGFAQEINPILRIDNTLWYTTVDERGDLGFGFYGGKVYVIWPLEEGEPKMVEKSFYVDLLLFSFVSFGYSPDIVPSTVFVAGIGFLFPIFERGFFIAPYGIVQLTALQDDWTP